MILAPLLHMYVNIIMLYLYWLSDPTFWQDYSNPLVRPHLHLYPEIPDGPITEVWHAEKWRKDLDPATLAPMIVGQEEKHYYINELVQMKNGELVVPVRWLKSKGRLHCEVFKLAFDEHVSGITAISG